MLLLCSRQRERLGKHLGKTPYLALVNIHLQEMKLSKQKITANLYHDLAMGKAPSCGPITACVCVMPDIVITRDNLERKGPGYTFAEAGVETRQTEASTLDGLIRDL